ncbi:nucleic-acid-binding protein from transposon X-element, partial [Trichonephila clavipes]
RYRLTGDFLKLYTDSVEERRLVVQLLKRLKFQFYTIKAKAERPIKVVIKGLPRTTNPEEIKQDLEMVGYTPERVNQLLGRKTKRALPIFLITLPRNLDNLKIFDLKTLSYLSIRVEGYDGKGVTQCYTCKNFNHSSENCYLNPRCLKCGENHITRDCPIKQKLETAYCINCQIYGNMANYKECPSFPNPPKGAAKNNRNSYTNNYNSLVRPNISYAQATTGTVNSKNIPQMATREPGFSAQTEESPKIRYRLTGDFLKLYTDSVEERRLVVQLLKRLKFQFYTIKAKAERPIKVVIKGLPRTTNPEEIKQDLEMVGYTPERVNQLLGRKTKRALPIFLITLPRNLDNLKIFDLKTLSYLSIRVEGYD